MTKRAVVLAVALTFGGACSSSSNSSGPDCAKICANMQAAHCPNDDPNCQAGCQMGAVQGPCKAQADAVSACWAGATFTCDQFGTSEAKDCQSQADALSACLGGGSTGSTGTLAGSGGATGSGAGSGGGGTGTGTGTGTGGGGAGNGTTVENCTAACTKADALHCPNNVQGACASQCPAASAQTQCAMEFKAVMLCAAGSTFACNSSGKATLQGCQDEAGAYVTCLIGSADGGVP
jgi:hypothetical protein